MKNKKTTLTGIITIATGALFIVANIFGVELPAISGYEGAVGAIVAGVGLFNAKDDNEKD